MVITSTFKQYSHLRIGCWNVQGLVSKDEDKSCNDTFLKEIVDFDIIGLLETHTVEGLNDNIGFEGYTTFNYHRPKHSKATHGSGGISVLLNRNIASGITLKALTNKDYVWLKLNKDFFNLQNDIHLCIAYIPPSESTYSKRLEINLLDQIETDIFSYKKTGDVILMGDLNARVGNCKDFIIRP